MSVGTTPSPVPLPPSEAVLLCGQPSFEEILPLPPEDIVPGLFIKHKDSEAPEPAASRQGSTASPCPRAGPAAARPGLKRVTRSRTHDGLLAEVHLMRKSQRLEDKKHQMRVMQEKLGASAKVQLLDALDPEEAEAAGCAGRLRLRCRRLIAKQKFDAAMGFVILANSVCIGLESEFELQGLATDVFRVLENLFLTVYALELALRFFAMGCACLASNWVRFDLVLVSQGAITNWVIEPLMDDAAMEGLGPLMVVRVLRLARLARTLRLLVQFQALWALVRGFLSSLGTMVYTVLLLTLMLYLFACLGAEVITKSTLVAQDPEFAGVVDMHFSSLPLIMLTLLQFVTLDSVAPIYLPIVKKQPYLIFYFVGFMVIVNITLMNLITAVIVEGAIENGKADRDTKMAFNRKKVEKMLPRIRALFEQLDKDGGGTVTLDEVAKADGRMREELLELIQSDNIVELFELLDVDGSGELDIQEFLDGIMMAVTSDTPIEFVRMQKQLIRLREKTCGVEKALTLVVEQIGVQSLRLKEISAQCEKLSGIESALNPRADRRRSAREEWR